MNNYSVAHSHCGYKMSLNVEGFSYSMRLKNILLCGAAAIYFQPVNESDRFEEYWFGRWPRLH